MSTSFAFFLTLCTSLSFPLPKTLFLALYCLRAQSPGRCCRAIRLGEAHRPLEGVLPSVLAGLAGPFRLRGAKSFPAFRLTRRHSPAAPRALLPPQSPAIEGIGRRAARCESAAAHAALRLQSRPRRSGQARPPPAARLQVSPRLQGLQRLQRFQRLQRLQGLQGLQRLPVSSRLSRLSRPFGSLGSLGSLGSSGSLGVRGLVPLAERARAHRAHHSQPA